MSPVLKKCRVCGNEIASDSKAPCPKCTTKDPLGKRANAQMLNLIFVLSVFIASGWMFYDRGGFEMVVRFLHL